MSSTGQQGTPFPKKSGVATAGVQRPIEDLPKAATFTVEGQPDWMAMTADAVWVSSADVNRVTRLNARTNTVATVITVKNPCSGLVADNGSLWIPSCGEHSLVKVNAETGAVQATLPVGPADSEGGIAVGAGSIWMVTADGELTRIDSVDEPRNGQNSNSYRLLQSPVRERVCLGQFKCCKCAGARGPGDEHGCDIHADWAEATVPDGGCRFNMGVESGRWQRIAGRFDDGDAPGNHSCWDSGQRRRDCVWSGLGMGDRHRVPADPYRSCIEQSRSAMAWNGRRQRSLRPRVGVAHEPSGRKGLAY